MLHMCEISMYILYNMTTYEFTHVPHGGDLVLLFVRAH